MKNATAGANHPERRFARLPKSIRARSIAVYLAGRYVTRCRSQKAHSVANRHRKAAKIQAWHLQLNAQNRGFLMHSLASFLLVLTSGFTASAIAANLYRISGFMPETTYGQFVRVCVLMFAGPSEMFESAITARMSK